MSENTEQENGRRQSSEKTIHDATNSEYKYGFTSDIDTEIVPPGLNEDVVRFISEKKGEPEWLLDFRLKAYRYWKTLTPPEWAHLKIPPIDFQAISYYAAPRKKELKKSMDEVDPELVKTFDKLGISLEEQKQLAGVAVDAVMDSVSVKTTHREKLAELGVIFCSFSEAVKDYPDLVKKYLGTVVPYRDNYYAALNSAVFSDGSFVYIPKGVRCPMELSTYFRINASGTGQFERTLIVADDDAYVSYLEGCTAPMRDENQLHAAIVEIICEERAEVKYSTVQNWYAGDKDGRGGIYNFVTKRGLCRGHRSKISWTQVETGSAITWKYPSCVLKGDESVGEFYSVAVTNNWQQADTGTKMIHVGRNSRSTIVSKGISAGKSQNSYRGLVRMSKDASGCRNFTQCDSLLMGDECGAHTFPYIDVRNNSSTVEHEATTSKINEEQLFYCMQRGIPMEEAVGLIVGGYTKEVMNKLPMEFAVEAQKLLQISLEGSVG
ncbi:MAG: Fe-S cluster assembly protein SufB [Muribaculaceae bacterium]|jgi:Fe-S cluster assembly protein SufB|uniref:Fe-S cluster assembly protein SufB n=2 Tax=Bacteroidales TaxID=171549 RepID=UPI000E9EA099|nr:Fe-S cluster assembly protein SufB [Sangeribacter muris]MBJ2194098.1 Fe-S cluster assembly protein SufB [Muribaculaceae bacterium]ROS84287.1 Fe-S cluster assembly protein SufB [Muribaculaceae bacterium Isolate-036 (Harlan)]ROT23144.1 Fe-S cluster assembly protein SufB [Muribaculaceae bacterium Isolate-114 (HZI)]ROT24254.1 Fe-S cluster assembly protein SufB [Muribaculaceae bacterium Isolate-113 (HZI)]RXE69262.1 Fe-S cluster assembly protein SufB [Muribaculaceae bacterium Isolate-001 (NCI)]H